MPFRTHSSRPRGLRSAPGRFVSLALFFASLLAATGARAQETQVVDEVVAVVEDDIILLSDVRQLVQGFLQQQPENVSMEQIWEEALTSLVNQKVLLAHAKRDTTIIVSEEQVNQQLDEWVENYVAQIGSQARLEELAGKSVVQLKQDNRQQMRDQLLVEQFRSRKLQAIRITPSEVADWWRQIPADSIPEIPELVRVAHIVRLPTIDPQARAEAHQIITAIRDSIEAGTPIEELAARYSDDPGSAANGGHYEDFNIRDLVPEFGAVASRMQPGELSNVFETQFGYHVLRLNKRVGDVVDFNHVLIRIDRSRFDPTEAVSYLNALRDSLVTHGAPIETLAKRHSEDPTSATRGGRVLSQAGDRDLPVEALGPLWQQTLDTLEVGEVSLPGPVELYDGSSAFHIVVLQDRTPAHRMSVETDYARIEAQALQSKRARVFREWVEQLRKSVYVDIRADAAKLTDASRR